MIAALASGLLTQLEGLGSIASNISGISSLLGGAAQPTPATTAPSCAKIPSGRPCSHHSFSDQLQALLLQQQQTQPATLPTDATQADDLSQTLQVS